MPRPIEAIVHRDALAANLEVAREAAAGARVWAVVKANAYGHGIAQRIRRRCSGADGFALLDFAEAERCASSAGAARSCCSKAASTARDLEPCSRLHLWHVVHCERRSTGSPRTRPTGRTASS